MDKSVKIEQTGLDVCITTTTYHYDAFGRRIAKRSTTQNQSKLTPKHEILPYQNTVQYDKNKQQTTLMLWDGNRPIQEYSDSHVFTTVYEQNSFAPVARLVWLKQALIDKKVSDKDKQWLTKFNQWALEQRINPRGKFQHDDDYAKKDKLDDIISIKVFYYHNDQLGTPNELTTNEGEVIWIADYKAWGNTAKVVWHEEKIEQLQIAKEHLQPIRFQGQFYDSETGLHYNRFRYYDNDVGMFISRDPIGLLGGENVFAYAPNPTGFIDPFGLALVNITLTEDYELIEAEGMNKYIPFKNKPKVDYLDSYTLNNITFDSNSNGMEVILRKPIIHDHNLNNPSYINFIGRGENIDNLTWERESCVSCAFMTGFRTGYGVGLGNANGIVKYSKLNLMHTVISKPSLMKGLSLNQAKAIFKGVPSWKEGVMKHSTRARGWTLEEFKNGQSTGRRIQYHPGTPRHFEGKPYWKISSGESGTQRFRGN